MKVLIIVPDYVNDNRTAYQFVHDRVKEYQKHFEVEVFIYDEKRTEKYSFENVNVCCGGKDRLLELVNSGLYDRYVFHFLNTKSALFILKFLKKERVYVWFHGSDCVSYKRRLPRINYSKDKLKNPIFLLKVFAFILFNKYKFYNIRKLNKKCHNLTFVFVSNWNKEASEKDIKIKYTNAVVIPNFINKKKFEYKAKRVEQRFKILSINNYANNIYAGDMTQDIIVDFSKRKEFKNYSFLICGDGALFDAYTEKLKNFTNVKIKRGFLSHKEINELQKEYGIFLYPKRGDSQGVSRCEAMASGLVCISSDVEAISEFTPEDSGYLVTSVSEFVDVLTHLCYNEKEFLDKSRKAPKRIEEKCSYEQTIAKEIELLR